MVVGGITPVANMIEHLKWIPINISGRSGAHETIYDLCSAGAAYSMRGIAALIRRRGRRRVAAERLELHELFAEVGLPAAAENAWLVRHRGNEIINGRECCKQIDRQRDGGRERGTDREIERER